MPADAIAAALQPSDTVLQLIRTLVAFDTVSRHSNLGLIEWVRDRLRAQGAACRLTYDATGGKANLFATLSPGRRPGLVLSGHTDVVPVDGQPWESDPFDAQIRDGRLYGRGTADMKSFIAVALATVPDFMAAEGHASFHLSLSYDEEIGCVGVRGLLRDLEANGIRPAGCIVGEPTSMRAVVAHKGKREYRCCVRGKEAHSALVPQGVNAIEFAALLIAHIRSLGARMAVEEPRDAAFAVPHTTLNTGTIQGGIATNVVPRDCEFTFDFRYLPGTDPDLLFSQVEHYAREVLLPQMRAIASEADIGFAIKANTPGLSIAPSHELVALAQALADSRGTPPGKVDYGTEAGLFSRAGIPTVVCGPGNIEQAHKPNEYIALSQVAQCEAFMRRLAQRQPQLQPA
ncbi:acetylornithine deacetylase [Ralstonia solanacearum]|uniref:acetylornithine deacetylase n=1 Tax=Ralstonia solanacearum TaxID=305 RepID=UPI003CC59264